MRWKENRYEQLQAKSKPHVDPGPQFQRSPSSILPGEQHRTRGVFNRRPVKTLDVTVTNTLVDNPVALAAWRRERRPRLRRPRESVAS